jgi:hypothetical protein
MATRKKKAVEPIVAAQHCGNCRFFKKMGDNGECRFNPPTVFSEGEAVFCIRPIMEPDDWCGQHQGTLQ